VFHLQRFHWKRRRAAFALLPAAVMMVATGFSTMATGSVPGAGSAGAEADLRVDVKRHARVGNTVKISGRVTPAQSRAVTITVDGNRVGSVRSDDDGRFRVRWRTRNSGIYTVRAIAQDSERAATSARSKGERLNVYRAAEASYYGPGLYGNATACGGRLSPSTKGVAHKTLPCGTKVTLRYRGRTVRVPVIDRGPYAGNREYDLTAATKAKLRFGSTGRVLTTR
jgi:rare lipoprotein A (peptidoglycan hydrolase)